MAQLTIEHLKGNTYYIACPTNIGFYVEDGEATVIDSGIDKDMGKQILKLVTEKGWVLKHVVNTHSHSDHIGGNAYLVEKAGCGIYAPKGEVVYIEDTLIEPAFLYGGFPFRALRNKFLMAKPSKVNFSIQCEGVINGIAIEALMLPGHSMDMMGYRTPDGVVFTADALIPENIVLKYHLFYLWDIESHFETLQKLKVLEGDCFVPSHGKVIESLAELVKINRAKIEEIIEKIKGFCMVPLTTEQVLEHICRFYEINLNTTQYVLLSNTVKSYLSYMINEGMIETSFVDYKMTLKSK
ncbi:MAG: MBL fold metallo-hydrolase [Vallitaleaceae bacterium]|nr:MBL fold metallo-hydrolase [Vallitaleaceae bacterium]